ncbi:MAG TPA: TonB-dependent receptor [Blastocatellia bacterium]|nr:TonB-dependent receptor [Blastocatellia bacterium]
MKFVCTILVLIAVLCSPLAAAAQNATATLSGRVRDPQGALITKATIVVTQTDTGQTRETTTNHDGLYTVSSLAAGTYDIHVAAPGFADRQFKGVTLSAGQTVAIDAEMAVAGAAEVVDADTYEAPLVSTQSSAVDSVISTSEINSLPLNGRNYLELSFLIPGNGPALNFDPTKTETVLISSAGQFGRGGSVTVDGADNNDDVVGGSLQNISEDAVQEFQIATNRFSAELGRSGSSVINVVTKSGTNEFHGTGGFYYRDDALQGLPATFNRSTGLEPPFDREQYSIAAGGPIVKNKAWWFGSFEYRNQDGVVLIGERDTATRTILNGFAVAPLDDALVTTRADWSVNEDNALAFRYSFENSDATSASGLSRPIGSATQRQASENRYNTFLADWTWVVNPVLLNKFSFSFNQFRNDTQPVASLPQYTFPSIQDGASFRVPQNTTQKRLQFVDTVSFSKGQHFMRLGGGVQHIYANFDLGVFQQGRIEYVEDFPDFDRNGDGVVNDDDLLFSVTLRSGKPDSPLLLPDCNNTNIAGFFQDDWRIRPNLTLNLGVRYELDTNVKNISGYGNINPLVQPFLSTGGRPRDKNNIAPRVGFNWSTADGRTSVHGGYGIYYDRIVLEITSLERGLDGRALPIEVRAGNVFFVDPQTGMFPPFAPTTSNPFTGFVLPGAGASGINIIDNNMQNPMVQQMNVGIQHELFDNLVVRADYVHNFGTSFIIGRGIGTVFNPVVGGPDRVVNLESSVKTKYDALLIAVEKRYADRFQLRASYALSKSFNYANDDQIPFNEGPVDPLNLQREYGPVPNDQRHRFSVSGTVDAGLGIKVSGIWAAASGVPMDILLPSGGVRLPYIQRNAGGRQFQTGADLNAFISQVNAGGGVGGVPLPFVNDNAKFNDGFSSVDMRVSRPFQIGENFSIEPIVEVFNLFNVTNILGVSNVNGSGFANALVRDSNDPTSPGFLKSSSFGTPVTTAGGVFGSGGPRAFQFAVRVQF